LDKGGLLENRESLPVLPYRGESRERLVRPGRALAGGPAALADWRARTAPVP